jgi:hypothetical protein
VGRFICTNYWEIHYVEHCGKIYLHKILGNTLLNTRKIYLHKILGNTFMLNTVGRCIYTKYWEILYVEHRGKIYLHKILGNTLTVGIFIYSKYWEIHYVENCVKIY